MSTHKKGKSKHDEWAQSIASVFALNPTKVFNYKQIASRAGLNGKQMRLELEALLGQWVAEGKLVAVERGKFKWNEPGAVTEGRIDMTARGSAYVLTDEPGNDIYIAPKDLRNALHGDRVKVQLFARRKKGKLEGEVVKIIERARTEFVGTVQQSGSFWFLVPDNRKMLVDLFIPRDKLNGAQEGEKALARMTGWPEKASSPFGEIVQVFGKPGEHEVEIHAIMAEFNLPYAFPPEVEAEADLIPTTISEAEILKRRDFRQVPTLTIDPEDAKDFDDALSVQNLGNGRFEIGVHIADVTHYVKPDSKLEEEAYKRATSVYLVDRVVPMLPEVLSNGVCSLRPHEDKLCFSAVFEMDAEGHVYKQWIGRTAIHSQRRFTYAEAQAVIDTGQGDMADEITALYGISLKLRAERFKKGALGFEKSEFKFKLNEANEPIGVYLKEPMPANHLIEEFMLLANRTVATWAGKNADGSPTGRTFIYRIHDDPDPVKLEDLQGFVKQFGYQLNLNGRKSITKSLNQMLADAKGKGEQNMLETLAIRSMAKAVYSTKNIGHYGLAFDDYSHFTSPIRRYPDMMAHRLLAVYLKGKEAPKMDYEEACRHSSEREKAAADGERASVKYMQVKYMQQFVGQSFKGMITGVTDWGLFVEMEENRCEGMIRLRDLRDDFYYFDEKNHALVGDVSGKIYSLGDSIWVKVKAADLDKKQIDLVPYKSEVAPTGKR
jgi:ribonuclease R